MKKIIFGIIIATVLFGGAFMLGRGGSSKTVGQQAEGNVTVVDGRQIIEIDAKGGYFPKTTNARANMPTVIKMNTRGTFDCSSAVTIPSLGYRSNLPPTGETLIDIPPQNAGTKLQGLCSMGMYNFAIMFN